MHFLWQIIMVVEEKDANKLAGCVLLKENDKIV